MDSKGESSQDDIAIESAKSKEGVSVYQIDPVAEQKLVRKLDYILLPLFCLICECLWLKTIPQRFILHSLRCHEFH